MHRFMDSSCSNCNKFSHCCNNDLICISKYREKEQECEGLKNKIEFMEEYIKTVEKARNEIEQQLDQLKAENDKLKQALDEIEKQVKAMNNECFYDDICDCNNCDMKNGCSYYRKFKILNIINKVKEGK